MISIRWFEYRVGATWIKELQYQGINGEWFPIPTVQGNKK